MTGHKILIFFVVVAISCGLSYGGPFREEVPAPASFDFSEKSVQEEKVVSERETSNSLQTILDEIAPQKGPYQEWLISVSKTASDLLKQLSGFAPYITKLTNPIIKAARLVLENGRTYIVDYVRSLPPETARNIQLTIIELLKKLVNLNLVKAIVRILLQAFV